MNDVKQSGSCPPKFDSEDAKQGYFTLLAYLEHERRQQAIAYFTNPYIPQGLK